MEQSFICNAQGQFITYPNQNAHLEFQVTQSHTSVPPRLFDFFYKPFCLTQIKQWQKTLQTVRTQKKPATLSLLLIVNTQVIKTTFLVSKTKEPDQFLLSVQNIDTPPTHFFPASSWQRLWTQGYELWLKLCLLTRFKFTLGSLLPMLVATCYSGYTHGFEELPYRILCLGLLAVFLLHSTTNALNDYFDFRSNTDQYNQHYLLFLTGGSRLLPLGLLSPNTLLLFSCFSIIATMGIGYYLFLTRGIFVLIFGFIGAFCAYFYTTPPIQLAARGLGELAHIICLGPLVFAGTRLLLLGEFFIHDFCLGLPFGILITVSLLSNEFPDYPSDKKTGKYNWVVRLGPKYFPYGILVLLVSAYTLTAVSLMLQYLPLYAGLIFLTLPLAYQLQRTAYQLPHHPTLYAEKQCETAFSIYFSYSLLLTTGVLLCVVF